MTKTLAILATCVLASCVLAQTPPVQKGDSFGYSIAYDFTAHRTLALGSYTATEIPDAFGIKGLNLQGLAFAGTAIGHGGLTGGMGIGLTRTFGKVTGIVGIGQAFFADTSPHGFAFAGISGTL